MSNKIGILSLGCARNLVDSEVIAGRLKEKGYRIVDLGSVTNGIFNGIDKVDIVIVNTCAFIKEAKEESVQTILDLIEAKSEGRLKRIIVAGCLSQRYKGKLLKSLPEIDAFLGVLSLNHTQGRFPLTPAHYAYVKICEGCINSCSFCIIPKIKSRFRSRHPESIISQIQTLETQGCREINLIGQDITAYGWDLYGEFRLAALLKQILRNSGRINWLRLLYLAPERLSDELIELIASYPGIVKYIDLPLQHINNRILKLMRRNVSLSQIFKLIDKIRKKIPDVAIRTSLIVGFPTETDREFKQLLNFIQDVRFERLGLFMYSREEGTEAYGFSGQIPQRIKEERYNIIMSAQQEVARQINERWQGEILNVLIEEKQEDGLYIGRSQYDAPEVDGLVYVKSREGLAIGNFINAKIIDTLEYDLVGQVQ
jgi:ribosomal protein S12 methylthiotransferase